MAIPGSLREREQPIMQGPAHWVFQKWAWFGRQRRTTRVQQAMAEVEAAGVTLGSRCACEGHYGTVRYVGEVPPSKGSC